jgi:hypothetical protein
MKRLVSQIQLNSASAQQRRLANTVILRQSEARAHGLRVLSEFYRCKLRQKVVLATRWCHRQFLMSPMLMFFVWRVPLKSYSTFSAVRNLAEKFPLKHTFVILTLAMTPSLSFYYCTLCILPRCEFWAIKRRDMLLLSRDMPVNV